MLQSDEVVLHLEFQTQPKADIPFRMIDYRLRVYRRFKNKRMRQVVIYLQQTNSELIEQTTFTLEETFHKFEVIRLWEQPTSVFLEHPGLLPFAVLSQTNNRTATLQQFAQEISEITDEPLQNNIAASAFILAGLVLEKDIIQQLLRRELMQESVTYQAIKNEGRAEEVRRVAVNLLKEGMSVNIVARVTGLSLEEVQELVREEAGNAGE